MTATETQTDDRPEAGAAPVLAPPPDLPGLAGLVSTSDHKKIGRLFVAGSILYGLAAAVVGVLLGAERVNGDVTPGLGDDSTLDLLDLDTFAQTFTFHSITGLFLLLLPLWLGIALVVCPLQIGARTMAFPRAALAAFWGWFLGGGILIASFIANGGPFGGEEQAVDLFLVSLALVVGSLLVATLCVVATVLTLRARGMTLERTPVFSWSMVAAGTMWLLTLPVFLANLFVFWLDHKYGSRTLASNVLLYGPMRWVFQHPQVFAFAVPVLGLAGDVVPVFARIRQRLNGVILGAIAAFAVLGFGALTNGFAAGVGDDVSLAGITLLAVLPILALLALWGDSLRRGRLRFDSPLLYALGSVALLELGVVAAAASVIDPFDLDATRHFGVGVSHTVLLAAGLLGAFGALHYWAPKIFGRVVSEGGGRVVFALLFLGGALVAAPDLVAGVVEAVADTGDDISGTLEALNAVSAAGGVLVSLGVLAFLANLAASPRDHERAGDPYDGHTLEWATASPPAALNFDAEPPAVTDERPLLADADAGATDG